jgi:hypothetical protein
MDRRGNGDEVTGSAEEPMSGSSTPTSPALARARRHRAARPAPGR